MPTTRPMPKGSVCVNSDLRTEFIKPFKSTDSLNLGSGEDYIDGWVNLDLDPNMKPDVVHNIDDKNLQLPFPRDMFDLIWCCNVMEHVWYLPQLKNECLRILKPGGVLLVIVPHYLSIDAWGDDTHVRAFSEHSWYKNYWPGWYRKYQHQPLIAKDSVGRELQWMAIAILKPDKDTPLDQIV